jgi:hypothetical protein
MRVRCSFCGAEYEAAVTRAALLLVARCEHCGRDALRDVDADWPGEGEERSADKPRRAAP